MGLESSVTRLVDFLDFCQLLKPLATINLSKSPTLLGNFCKGVKIYHFSCEIILGNFYRHLAIFSLVTLLVIQKSWRGYGIEKQKYSEEKHKK